jgi:type I pantothenate kinase
MKREAVVPTRYSLHAVNGSISPYIEFDRASWAALRATTPMTLTHDEVEKIRGINVELSTAEVESIYLPLSRLLNLYVRASQALFSVTDTFLGRPTEPVPYVIAIAGSVAVGKSTIARIMQMLLSRWPDHPSVDLVTTDGFLYPNATLEERRIMHRKGFPESYDRRRLLQFVTDLKAGAPEVRAPIYSHLTYDILPDQERIVRQPQIVILEGLNVLQGGGTGTYVSDYFDFSIYVDAEAGHIGEWYLDRFLTLRDTAFRDEASYFHRYAGLSDEVALEEGMRIWREINEVNLEENILPTRERATLILHKAADHAVQHVMLRRG